jgi:hypothetical protein
MLHRSLPFLLIALFLPIPAFAEKPTYQWRDKSGVTHFTDNSDSIPDPYLKTVKELAPMAAKAEAEAKAKAEAKVETTQVHAASPTSSSASDPDSKKTRKSEIAQQLEQIRKELAAKKSELARLRHRWAVAKGRTPTEKELKDYEEKKKKGKVTAADNPYVNKSALSLPGPRRAAYYRKLHEIEQDEERIRELEKELETL